MTYVVIWDAYESGDYSTGVEEFATLADAEEFVNATHEGIDYERRQGRSVLNVYEVARELFLHPVQVVESYELRDTPPA